MRWSLSAASVALLAGCSVTPGGDMGSLGDAIAIVDVARAMLTGGLLSPQAEGTWAETRAGNRLEIAGDLTLACEGGGSMRITAKGWDEGDSDGGYVSGSFDGCSPDDDGGERGWVLDGTTIFKRSAQDGVALSEVTEGSLRFLGPADGSWCDFHIERAAACPGDDIVTNSPCNQTVDPIASTCSETTAFGAPLWSLRTTVRVGPPSVDGGTTTPDVGGSDVPDQPTDPVEVIEDTGDEVGGGEDTGA